MSCLGVHFAITAEEANRLIAIADEKERLAHLQEVIEETYFAYPLNHAVLGGRLLYTDGDYIMSLKSPTEVRDVAAALSHVTEEEFRRRDWFQGVRDLFAKAARDGRYVLFTADQ